MANYKLIIDPNTGIPIPQYYNPTTDQMEALEGASGSNQVQLTGRNVQTTTVYNALAITDTANHDVANVDCTAIGGRKLINILNMLNQSVTITVFSEDASNGTATIGTKTVSASSAATISSSDFAQMADPHYHLYFRAACTTAPTSGTLTVYLQGVQD